MAQKKPLAEDLTVPELKAALDKAHVEYSPTARRDDLVDLAAQNDLVQTEDDESEDEPTTKVQGTFEVTESKKPEPKVETKSEPKKADAPKATKTDAEPTVPDPASPTGEASSHVDTPHPAAPFTDFAAAAQTRQYQADQSALHGMATPPAAAVEAEKLVETRLAEAAGGAAADEKAEAEKAERDKRIAERASRSSKSTDTKSTDKK